MGCESLARNARPGMGANTFLVLRAWPGGTGGHARTRHRPQCVGGSSGCRRSGQCSGDLMELTIIQQQSVVVQYSVIFPNTR